MIKQKLSLKRLLTIAGVIAVGAISLLFINQDNGLPLEQIPSTISVDEIDWASEKQTFFNYVVDDSPPERVEGLPTDDHVYFTNIHFADEYQFAQTGGKYWTDSQRLFWRKDSTMEWQEITLTDKDFYPSYFVSKNGRQYLAAIGGEISEDRYLYFIDVDNGTLQKEFKAGDLVISPDGTKILCNDNNQVKAMGFHELIAYDLTDDSKTQITNLVESSPGSGKSFEYIWSKDSNFVEIKGTKRKSGESQRFWYIYDHENKKLFSV